MDLQVWILFRDDYINETDIIKQQYYLINILNDYTFCCKGVLLGCWCVKSGCFSRIYCGKCSGSNLLYYSEVVSFHLSFLGVTCTICWCIPEHFIRMILDA